LISNGEGLIRKGILKWGDEKLDRFYRLKFCCGSLYFAKILTDKVANATTEIELSGMRMAAIRGESMAVTANDNPITL
jgi:hypothetical protein